MTARPAATDGIAAGVCALAIDRLDNAVVGRRRVHTYGSHPEDAELVPPPTRTVLLVTDDDGGHWYELVVRQLSPDLVTAICDPEILATLRHRATAPSG